ncbi:hypothetical protein CEB3_c40110 [Peptococcaceae bacterium CEB3]|nr:hypothetical protein CEB3_c40110 [Peptococcaceae bacterium CEB3]
MLCQIEMEPDLGIKAADKGKETDKGRPQGEEWEEDQEEAWEEEWEQGVKAAIISARVPEEIASVRNVGRKYRIG